MANSTLILKQIGTVLSLTMLFACASNPTQFSTSNRIPGAAGQLKTEKTDNENTEVNIQVKHLADPGQVSPSATTYVVWARPLSSDRNPASESDDQVQNLGALKVDEDLTGRLTTTTPFQQFEVFITPEPSRVADSPTGPSLLWTAVNE